MDTQCFDVCRRVVHNLYAAMGVPVVIRRHLVIIRLCRFVRNLYVYMRQFLGVFADKTNVTCFLQTATSLKVLIGNWNIQTTVWLRRICYERAPVYPTFLTYLLSALWHGYYPGYYFTFISGAFFTLAGRNVSNDCLVISAIYISK